METITISTLTGSAQVPATRYGLLAVHTTHYVDPPHESQHGFSISHVPSGLCLLSCLTESQAQRLASTLQSFAWPTQAPAHAIVEPADSLQYLGEPVFTQFRNTIELYSWRWYDDPTYLQRREYRIWQHQSEEGGTGGTTRSEPEARRSGQAHCAGAPGGDRPEPSPSARNLR